MLETSEVVLDAPYAVGHATVKAGRRFPPRSWCKKSGMCLASPPPFSPGSTAAQRSGLSYWETGGAPALAGLWTVSRVSTLKRL